MRKERLGKLVADIVADDEKEVARDMMVERFGPRCAAWLVFEHRALLHKRGVFDIIVPDKISKRANPKRRLSTVRVSYEPPMWFSLAVSFLRRRPGWSVEVISHRGERRFRVRWFSWPHWAETKAS